VNELIAELKVFLIETLALEDIRPEDIDPDAPLFDAGLGLDSIDALEIGVGLQKRYGITLNAKAEETRQAFASLRHLASFISRGSSATPAP
jgi:acyl carrier protein